MPKKTQPIADSKAVLAERVQKLALWGLLEHLDEAAPEPWVPLLLGWEEVARSQRSLQRRLKTSRIGRFKPMADFDWSWPEKIDRADVEELFTLRFLDDKENIILVGPNGVGKSMIAQNLAHHALIKGHTVRFTTAAKLLGDLVTQDTSTSLERRLRRYCRPNLLVCDEVGYLSYDNRHADLLYEVVTRRYNEHSTLITTNKSFADWGEVFPNAGCTVTLIDRLVHHSEIVEIKGESYRFKEAKERAVQKARERASLDNTSNSKRTGRRPS